MTKLFNYGEFEIVTTALSSSDATFQIAATKANRKGQDSGSLAQYYEFPDATITNFYIDIEEKGGARKELVGIASLADSGSNTDDGTRNIYTLTVREYSDASTKMRGVKQDHDGTNNISNQDTDAIVDSFPVGSKVKIVVDAGELARIDAAVAASSEINDFSPQPTANGAVGAGVIFYLDSNGKAVAGTNSGAFDGCNITAATDGNQINGARYIASGITVPGSIGDTIYAVAGTGALTATAGSNTRVGRKQASDTLVLFNMEVPSLTEAQARDNTSTNLGIVSGELVATAYQEGEATYAADAEANDTYVITLAPAPTALTTGMQIKFKANTANTGACTLNVNSIGAKAITKNGTEALGKGDIAAGQIVTVVYDGTQFQLQTPSSAIVPVPIGAYQFNTNFEGTGSSRYTAAGGGTGSVTYGTVNGLNLETTGGAGSEYRSIKLEAGLPNTMYSTGTCIMKVDIAGFVTTRAFCGLTDTAFTTTDPESVDTDFVGCTCDAAADIYAVHRSTGNALQKTKISDSGSRHIITIVKTGATSIKWYTDGVLAATHTTDIPSVTNLFPFLYTLWTGGVATRYLRVYSLDIIGH